MPTEAVLSIHGNIFFDNGESTTEKKVDIWPPGEHFSTPGTDLRILSTYDF